MWSIKHNIMLLMFALGPARKKMAEQDPFDFLLEASEISSSQEELLRAYASPLEPVNAGDDSQAVLQMFSLPETQDAAGGSGTQGQEDVFHTPPEKSSVPSSADQPPLGHCEINRELDARDDENETLGFVDLGRDSELGFSEVKKPSEGVEGESVAQSPRGIKRDAVAAEESEGFERESCVGELPVKKKSKLLEPNLGIESQGLEEEGNGKWKVEGDVEPEKGDLAEGRVSGKEEDHKKRKNFVFDVLKFLAENSPHDNEDGNGNGHGGGGNASLEEDVFEICGIDFPRPRWWPDTDLFR